MKIYFLSIICSLVGCIASEAQDITKKLAGLWKFSNSGAFFKLDGYYDHIVEPIDTNYIFFKKGRAEVRSGIFRLNIDRLPGREYPWVYCGNFANYRVKGDSIYFIGDLSTNKEEKFYFVLFNSDSLVFKANDRTYYLHKVKKKPVKKSQVCEIVVNIMDGTSVGMDIIANNKMIKVTQGNEMFTIRSKKYITYAFDLLSEIDFSNIKDKYISTESENRLIDIKMRFNDGSTREIKIIGASHPNDLRISLIPFIYAVDFQKYGHTWVNQSMKR